MIPDSRISRTVLRRVRIIHVVRTYAAPVMAATLFIIALWGIGREVWVAKVFANMPDALDALAVARFFAGAFLNTDLVVQASCVGAVGALAWLAAGIARTLSTVPRFA